jgi:hypothetical protein
MRQSKKQVKKTTGGAGGQPPVAYRIDIHEFMGFVGIGRPEEFRIVTRSHVLAWRKDLEGRELGGATIRRKLAALSSLFAPWSQPLSPAPISLPQGASVPAFLHLSDALCL